MPNTRYSRWQGFVARAAIFLLLAQAVFGPGACRQYGLARADSGAASRTGIICTLHGAMAATADNGNSSTPNTPANDTQHPCPACLSLICHVSAILAAVNALPDRPKGAVVFAPVQPEEQSGTFASVFRNRGPPASLIA